MAGIEKASAPRAGAHTVIGSSIVIDGEISGDEDLVIQGTVKGRISLKESLYVESSGVIEADIETANVEVSGQVTGNIAASEALLKSVKRKFFANFRVSVMFDPNGSNTTAAAAVVACVLPFLVRRVGFQKAHYLTLTTQPVSARQACEWGLVDVCEPAGEVALRRHLQRLRRLSKVAIRRYKTYADRLGVPLRDLREAAVAGNREVFGDAANLRAIARYVERGLLPWETA